MANKKISELNLAQSIEESDLSMIVQNGENKKVTLGAIRTNVNSVNINALQEKSVTTSTDYVLISDSTGNNRKVLVNNIKGSGSGGGSNSAADLDWSTVNETLNPDDANYVLINDGTTTKKVKVEKLKGSTNVTEDYVELTGDDEIKYRVKVVNGELVAYKAEVDTKAELTPSEENVKKCAGLIINKVFAGGSNLDKASASHNFIELYNLDKNPNLGINSSNGDINLKGVYLFYKPNGGAWTKYALSGIVPKNTSFLIRGKYVADPIYTRTRVVVDHYDLDIPTLDLSLTKGFTLLLYIGGEDVVDADLVRNRKDPMSGVVTWTNTRYIDMLGVGIKDGDNPPHAEGSRWKNIMSITTGAMREDFANSGLPVASNKEAPDDNFSNIIPLDLSTCDLKKFGPKSVRDGVWDYHLTRDWLNPYGPNMINMCYGEKADTTRTFTWHTALDFPNFIKYKKSAEQTWTKIAATKETVTTLTGTHYVHRVIISELEHGNYDYMVGREGAWSDVETFEVKDYQDGVQPINILWTTDEQGFTTTEYEAVRTAAKFIEANESFDFHLNTGDVTQNANVPFEWLSYYDYYSTNRKICHMTTCGNNDLTENKYLDMYSYFNTHENEEYPSTHAWDMGCTHFICLNSNDVTGYKNLSPDAFLKAQATWLEAHLTQVALRETQPKWIVLYMHYSPFTVVRDAKRQIFVEIFEKYKIDLVISGHNHRYSRSIPIYSGFEYSKQPAFNKYADSKKPTGYTIVKEMKGNGLEEINRQPDPANGTYYVMCQATGYKLRTGKEDVLNMATVKANVGGEIPDFDAVHTYNGEGILPWWSEKAYTPQNPMYGTIKITADEITINMYEIENILEYTEQKDILVHPYATDGAKVQTKRLTDTLVIRHSERTTGR